jgi:glycosyltransferase involved in cell wall biosynthesis
MDAINSVHGYSGVYSYEIIIVDDGSTDQYTIELLEELSKNYIVEHQANKGPATARNTGCKIANGKYLLFLDSDNKIDPKYIDVGITSLESDINIGVVYASPYFFGENISSRKFIAKPFNINKMLVSNYIDTCAVVRKEVWSSVGGFDESPEMFTLEDWDFWLRIYEKGWKFMFIDKQLFYYRLRNGSLMDKSHKTNTGNKAIAHIYKRHALLVAKQHQRLYESLDYKIGSKLLRPYRFIKRIVKQYAINS